MFAFSAAAHADMEQPGDPGLTTKTGTGLGNSSNIGSSGSSDAAAGGGDLEASDATTTTTTTTTKIPTPVICITTGAPKVGNLHFWRAFEELEAANKLRCLRISNDRDIVTLSPPNGSLGCCIACCCPTQRFRHVGLRLKLHPTRYLFSYPPKAKSYCRLLFADLVKSVRSIVLFAIILPMSLMNQFCDVCRCWCCKNKLRGTLREEHTQLEYMRRFDAHRAAFEQLTLEQLYEERAARSCWRVPLLRGKIITV